MTGLPYAPDNTLALFISDYEYTDNEEAYQTAKAINKAFSSCRAILDRPKEHTTIIRLRFSTEDKKEMAIIANNVHWFIRGRRSKH